MEGMWRTIIKKKNTHIHTL